MNSSKFVTSEKMGGGNDNIHANVLITVEEEAPTGYLQGRQKPYLFNVFLLAILHHVVMSTTQNVFITITLFAIIFFLCSYFVLLVNAY